MRYEAFWETVAQVGVLLMILQLIERRVLIEMHRRARRRSRMLVAATMSGTVLVHIAIPATALMVLSGSLPDSQLLRVIVTSAVVLVLYGVATDAIRILIRRDDDDD